MRIVVDIGSAAHGGDTSIPHLVEEYRPDVLYGLDPQTREATYDLDGTLVLERPWAAWTYNGTVGWGGRGLGGQVREVGTQVPCVDLAEFLDALAPAFPDQPEEDQLIVKMDAEGAEYTLLPYLAAHGWGVDLGIEVLRVEWHCELCGYGIWHGVHPVECANDGPEWHTRKAAIIESLACPVEEWAR